jgi:hypothetical protein
MRNPFVQPAAIGGLVGGVLSALPLISAANLCCCLWVVAGGVVAAYVLQLNARTPVTPADGALVGLLAGVLGAVIYLLLSIPITFALEPLQRQAVERLIDSGNIPPEFREYLDAYSGGLAGIAFGFFLTLAAGIVFSTAGGLLGALVFRKSPDPPGTIDVTPSAP